MLKNQQKNSIINFKYIKSGLICIIGCFFLQFIYWVTLTSSQYSFFIEFNDANGLMVGTPIRMRGVNIGFVRNIQLKINCVLVLATIYSKNTIIDKDSIIETTQTGLLNEAVVDIIPLKAIKLFSYNGPLSSNCNSSQIICNNMYILGDKGLNYDDLVRSTTRISQRFDDPRFFYLFALFLKSTIKLTDSLSIFLNRAFYIFEESN